MRPHYSQSCRENETPSSGTSPLASYKEVPPPPRWGGFQMQICSVLLKCCVHLRTSSNKTQMLLAEKNIFHNIDCFCYRFTAFTFDLCSLLSFVCHSSTKAKTMQLLRRPIIQRLWPDSGQILRHRYGISVAELQTFLLAKRPQRRRARRNGCLRRLEKFPLI